MDTTDAAIQFDADGVCNHCHRYEEIAKTRLGTTEQRKSRLDTLLKTIKMAGQGKPYDCIIGLSGGVDSTYVAYLVKTFGLRPLAVHLDNGWDSELAVKNIEQTLKSLNIELVTHVLEWEDFRDLQLSFLHASTPDGEVPTDHAILAVLYQTAARLNVRYVITGTNIATEAVLPLGWGYGYFDWKYIKSVHRQFGQRPLRNYPHLNPLRLAYYVFVRGIRLVSILNYVEYEKTAAMRTIERELGWRYYGGKHYESIYTRFFQAYILPRKFSIDKRRAHYSNLVWSGQMSRSDALDAMGREDYGEAMVDDDRDYVVKKLGLQMRQFDEIMAAAPRRFSDFPNSHSLFEKLKQIRRWVIR